jgi:hypothetical protein
MYGIRHVLLLRCAWGRMGFFGVIVFLRAFVVAVGMVALVCTTCHTLLLCMYTHYSKNVCS